MKIHNNYETGTLNSVRGSSDYHTPAACMLETRVQRKRNTLSSWCILTASLSFLCIIAAGCGGSPVDALRSDLQSEDSGVRKEALLKLEELGSAAGVAVPELIELLKSNDTKLQYRSLKVLSKMDREAIPAADALAELLKNSHDEKVRYYTIKTLANIDEAAVVALDDLVKAAQDKDAKIRYYAIKAIGKIGSEASSALPVIKKALDDADEKVRKAANSAIKKIQV